MKGSRVPCIVYFFSISEARSVPLEQLLGNTRLAAIAVMAKNKCKRSRISASAFLRNPCFVLQNQTEQFLIQKLVSYGAFSDILPIPNLHRYVEALQT